VLIITNSITINKLNQLAQKRFGNFVKAVVDIKKEVVAIDGELHSDEEALLLSKGSKQENLWGINLYPDIKDKNWIEFDSMINIKPSYDNNSRGVDNPEIRKEIVKIVTKLVEK
jgi:hypothetical protein